jgi:AcrR family transcriptional regulator
MTQQIDIDMSDSVPVRSRESGRDRLLDAANQLFYAEGIQTVGIDRIIEQAGVAKATLYNNFASKEELVQAYLRSRHDRTRRMNIDAIASVDDPMQKILAVFDAQAGQFREPTFNGCAFASAAAEEPLGGLVDQAVVEFRHWIREMFTGLAEEAGASDAVGLGRQLHVLYDGAGLAAAMDHDPAIAEDVRRAVEAMLDRALGSSVQ